MAGRLPRSRARSRRGSAFLDSLLPAAVPVLLAGLVAAALGWAAMLPGVGFWDTAEFQVVGPVLGTAHPTGFPAYVLLTWLASIAFEPLGEPAFRVNLLSAILVGAAAGGLAVVTRLLTGRPWLGAAAAIVLATTPLVWSLGTHADPHAFNLAMVAIVLCLLLAWEQAVVGEPERRGRSVARAAGRAVGRAAAVVASDRLLLAASIAYGIALAGHSISVLLAPGIGLFVAAVEPGLVRRPRFLAACLGTVVLSAGLLYLELPLRAFMGAPLVYDHPDTLIGFASVVLGVQFMGGLAHPLDVVGKLASVVDVAAAQLGILAPLVPLGLAATALRRPRYVLLTLPGVVLTCWFAASYPNAGIARYYAGPILAAMSWLAVLAALAADGVSMLARRALPGAFGRWPVELAVVVLLLAPAAAAAPDRFAAIDQRSDTTASVWLDETLAALPPRAVVISWWDYSTTLWYGQLVEGRRPDIWIVDDRTRLDQGLGEASDVISSQLGQRPVYVIRLPGDLAALAGRFDLEPVPNSLGIEPIERVVRERTFAMSRP